MLYFIKKLSLPIEIKKYIFEFIDYTNEIKNKQKIWYKRLITDDYYYYSKLYFTSYKGKKISLIKLCLEKEAIKLNILIKNKAYTIIQNIHMNHLK
tara:strand:- start:1657 stop:1944 length:288 start_codon:yes stop_codon:yes gene_type:complete